MRANSTRLRMGSMRSARTRTLSPRCHSSWRGFAPRPGGEAAVAAANDARTRAASSATASGTSTTSDGDDDVIAFAQHAARTGEFFQSADGKKAFDEDFEEFDEAAVLLHGNDQAVVLLAEMFFHELSGFPVHEFALGAIGAAFGFGGLRSDFFEVLVRIQRGLGARGGGDAELRRCRGIVGMYERPF